MRQRDPQILLEAARAGDRVALARLLSLVEQGGDAGRQAGRVAYPLGGKAYTVGITGSPGAGKSTLTDRLISAARAGAEQVAVVAVDPSSPFSGGAILGDRVRMGAHFTDPGVFIRSMATRGHLGGLAVAAPEAIRVLDAVGFPWIFVETVGVGQAEVEIAGAADTTVVVVNPGWGDSVQANKAGIMEIADIFVINKADRPGVQVTQRDIESMLDLSAIPADGWRPPVMRTVAAGRGPGEDDGVGDLWKAIAEHRARVEGDGTLATRRAQHMATELRELVVRMLEAKVHHAVAGETFAALFAQVVARALDPQAAAESLLAAVLAAP